MNQFPVVRREVKVAFHSELVAMKVAERNYLGC